MLILMSLIRQINLLLDFFLQSVAYNFYLVEFGYVFCNYFLIIVLDLNITCTHDRLV